MGGAWLVCICSQDTEAAYSCSASFLLSIQSKSFLILTNQDYKIPQCIGKIFPMFCFHCESDDFFPQDRVSLCHNPSCSGTSSVDSQASIVSPNPVKLTIKIIHHIMMDNAFSIHEHFLLLCLRNVVWIPSGMCWMLYTPLPFLQKKS